MPRDKRKFSVNLLTMLATIGLCGFVAVCSHAEELTLDQAILEGIKHGKLFRDLVVDQHFAVLDYQSTFDKYQPQVKAFTANISEQKDSDSGSAVAGLKIENHYGGTLNVDANLQHTTDTQHKASVTYHQPLMRGGGRLLDGLYLGDARRTFVQKQQDILQKSTAEILKIKTAYRNVMRQVHGVDVATKALRRATQLLGDSELKYKLGRSTRADVLDKGLNVRVLSQQLETQNFDLKSTKIKLAQLIGRDTEKDFQVSQTLDGDFTKRFDFESLYHLALRYNFALQTAKRTMEQGQSVLVRANDALLPEVSLALSADTDQQLGAQLSLSYNPDDKSKKRSLEKAQVQLEKQRSSLADQQHELYLELQRQLNDIQKQQKSLVQLARQAKQRKIIMKR